MNNRVSHSFSISTFLTLFMSLIIMHTVLENGTVKFYFLQVLTFWSLESLPEHAALGMAAETAPLWRHGKFMTLPTPLLSLCIENEMGGG